MIELARGANCALTGDLIDVRVRASYPVDVLALLVDGDQRVRGDDDLVFWNAPVQGGVQWSAGEPQLTVDTSAVPAPVSAVLVVLALTEDGAAAFGDLAPAEVSVTAFDRGRSVREDVRVPMQGLDRERAIIGVELYRRGASWKLRSVAQGQAAGLAHLLSVHGIAVDDPGESAAPEPPVTEPAAPPVTTVPGPTVPSATQSPTTQPPTAQASGSTHLVGYADRAWLIWEDASRSLSAYRSSHEFALHVRDDELAGRPVQRGFQDILAAAQQRLNADMAYLTAELAGTEASTPAAMAEWNSPNWLTWAPGPEPQPGVLAGHLGVPEAPGLRIPLVLRHPWLSSQWISAGPLPADSVAFGWSLVTRYLAALPAGAVAVEVVDLGGLAGLGWLHALPRPVVEGVLAGGVATGLGPSAARLGKLLDIVDLRSIGAGDEADRLLGGRPLRLVVVIDPNAGEADDEVMNRLVRLAEDGPSNGVPTICIETDGDAGISLRGIRLRQAGQSLPSGSESTLGDPWVRSEWGFTPEVMPDAASVMAGNTPAFLRRVLAAQQAAAE